MTKRLKAYVRKTILASATEGAWPKKRRTPESTKSAFIDAMRGTDTGWWCDLIYNNSVLVMFNRYRSDIAAAIREYVSECGMGLGDKVLLGDSDITWADLLAATARRQPWEAFSGDMGEARQEECEAAMLAIRFAVEYLAGEVAREYCPDL